MEIRNETDQTVDYTVTSASEETAEQVVHSPESESDGEKPEDVDKPAEAPEDI